MKKIGPWITNVFIIFAAAFATSVDAANKRGVKAVILYTYDDATIGSNVVSMEVDKNAFMTVIKDAQFQTKAAKPLRFAEDNGFFALLEGASSSFSFATEEGMADCDCKCTKKVITTTTTQRTTTRPTIPITTPYRPITTPALRILSTPAPTYLPSLCANGGKGEFCCLNGASNPDCCGNGGSGPDCCLNGGRGQHCCTNGATNADCCLNGGSGPDCCINGGKGKYCCTNGQNNPECSTYIPPPVVPVVPTSPSKPPPRILECPNGGTGQYCCKNGANNVDCCTNAGGKGKYCCSNGSNSPNCDIPKTPTTPTQGPTVKITPATPTVRITKKPFQGPLYLPQSTIKTTRGPTTTQTYTFGSVPTNTYKYTWTYGPWSGPSRNPTSTYTTTTTPKYSYTGDGSIQYNSK